MSNSLKCLEYDVSRRANEPVLIRAVFVLPVNPHLLNEIAEALKNIELLLASDNGINFVQGSNRPRCSWCGVLHDEKICPQCGGSG